MNNYFWLFLNLFPLLITSQNLQMHSLHVYSKVSHRYAKTTVVSKVKNSAAQFQDFECSMYLPTNAFVSGFIMEVGKQNYTSSVEQRKPQNQQPTSSTSGQIVRDSNRFVVTLNIQGNKEVTFYFEYEELLVRKSGLYELVFHINPGQIINDLKLTVEINESKNLLNVKTVPLRIGNGNAVPANLNWDSYVKVNNRNLSSAIITFAPDYNQQEELISKFGTNKKDGLVGQFVTQYDVERTSTGGQLLIHDDHFIHFFAPTNLAPIPKHVVFILDISISMVGPKLDQVKTAMTHILAELKEFDLFHIVEFGSRIKIIDLDNVGGSRSYTYEEVNKFSENTSLPLPKLALQQHILSANNAVKEMWVDGATDILSALKTGVTLIRLAKLLPTTGFRQPLIFFLTDGRSDTEYEINSTEILRIVTQQNVGTANIYALAFGDYADNNLLALLGALNKGVMKQIYSAQDAASQLRDFYNQISTPLLSNIKFNYPMAVTSVTKRNFDVYFKGSELVVSGKIVSGSSPLPNITATGAHPNPPFTAQTESTDLDLARFWAHLTIQQLLEESKTASNGADLKKTAEKLALNYSLVTPLSTLVIKQPGSSIPINIGPPFTESVPSSLLKPSYRDPIPTLPWLGNLLDDDGTFKGYGLALNETTDDFTSCPRTPLGGTGNCKLLHECLQIHNTLQDYKTFKKYFCNSNFNVGVCCPRRANRRHSG